jgi:hypothetical protein
VIGKEFHMGAGADRRVLLVIDCPECKKKREVQLNRSVLKEQLERGGNVRVTAVCGHDWSFTAHEKASLRKALAEGVI